MESSLTGDAQDKAVRHQPLLGLFLQARFTSGMFTVYPGFGSIPPRGQQMIRVDCCAEPLGTCEEHLSIDISNRDPSDNPLGIPYTLFAESCLPGTPRPQVPLGRPAAVQHPGLLLGETDSRTLMSHLKILRGSSPFQGYPWGEAGREAWRSERNAIPFKAEGN